MSRESREKREEEEEVPGIGRTGIDEEKIRASYETNEYFTRESSSIQHVAL